MGVYIDMEIPKVAGRMEAVITILKDGTAQIAISPADDEIGYWKEYPLIPIPPHGRLIDADKYLGTIRPLCPEDSQSACTFETVKKLMMNSINNAPTVIPAEEGET